MIVFIFSFIVLYHNIIIISSLHAHPNFKISVHLHIQIGSHCLVIISGVHYCIVSFLNQLKRISYYVYILGNLLCPLLRILLTRERSLVILNFKLSLFFFLIFTITCRLMLSNQTTFKRVFKLQNNTTKPFKMVEILDKS